MPEIAIIIPHYNDATRLARCLDALRENDLSGCEILVVDNGSDQPLDAVRAGFPEIRIVTEPEKGAAAARNRGVAETTAPRLMFIDADCVPAPDWVAVGRAVMDRADLIGGRVEVFDETPPPRSGAEAFEAVFAFHTRKYIENDGFSVTANLITRRDVFADVGPFRGGMSEDCDWCFRATAKGYRLIYADNLCVGHPSRQDWPALRAKWRRIKQELFGQTGSGAAARIRWALKGLMMPVSILVHLPRVLTSRKLSGPRDRWRAAATLARLRVARMVWMLRQAAGLEI